MSAILKIKRQSGGTIEIPALQGASAYELAVLGGYEGTEEEFASAMANVAEIIENGGNTKLDAAGSSTRPIYINNSGTPTQISYSIAKDVPSNAVFTDTHHTAYLYVGGSTASSNSATSNGNTYLVLRENGSTRNAHKITGTGSVTVSSDSSGNITINGSGDEGITLSQTGSTTQPIYINSSGTPTATTYSLNKTVPSDAVFTDTTYSAASGGGLSLSGTSFSLATMSGMSASSYGPSSNKTLTYGGTFSIPYITTNTKGQITAISTKTMTMPAASSGGSTVSISNRQTSGTKLATITIDSTGYDLYYTNTNTHNTAYLYVGTSSGTSNSSTANGYTYLILSDGGSYTRRKITGTGSVTVTSDSSGNITIDGTGGGSTVSISDVKTTGTVLAKLTIDGTDTYLRYSDTDTTYSAGSNINISTGKVISVSDNITAYAIGHDNALSSTAVSTFGLGYSNTLANGNIMIGNYNTDADHSSGWNVGLGNFLILGANNYQTILGYCNSPVTSGNEWGSTIIGTGSSSSDRKNGLRVTRNGYIYGQTTTITSGADFAEYFEWEDKNLNNEDRRGRFVTLQNNKIRFANINDDYILGVITGQGAFIGNSASEQWDQKYLVDIYGTKLTQKITIPAKYDNNNNLLVPETIIDDWIINPDWDETQEYIPREVRPEWDPVGLIGQVVVIDDGTCEVGGFCKPIIDGIATNSETGYYVMKRLDDTHIKILLK